jgi:hypothetical protein
MTDFNLPMAINATAVVVGVVLVGYIGSDLLSYEKFPRCSKRFDTPTEFGLRSKQNEPLTPAHLQARAGGTEFGIMKNADIVALPDAPAPAVMKIKLSKGTGSVHNSPAKGGGVSFRWDPNGMPGATVACLTYQVKFPEKFEFGNAGVLPGLYGGGRQFNPKAASDGTNFFSSRLGWSTLGRLSYKLQAPGTAPNNTIKSLMIAGENIKIGQWVSIEQEIALNDPGQENGLLRLWVDGEIRINLSNVIWRNDPKLNLSGVLSDISYGNPDSTTVGAADAELNLTPMTISWKKLVTD